MKRKQQRKPNLTKYQLVCLRRRVLRGDRVPRDVATALCKKGYASGPIYYHACDHRGLLVMVHDVIPTAKARQLIDQLYGRRVYW